MKTQKMLGLYDLESIAGALVQKAREAKLSQSKESLSVEEIRAEFRLESAPALPTVYRYHGAGERYYFQFQNEDVIFLPSCTTVIRNTLPTSPGILKKMQELGSRYSDWLQRKADYGTFLHLQFANYLRNNKTYDFDLLDSARQAYSEEKKLEYDTEEWLDVAKKDLLSLIAFVQQHNVTPLYVEQPIAYYSGSDGQPRFGSVIDLVCEMDIEEKGFFGETYKTGDNKGEPKESKQTRRIVAAIDLKSGKAGFWDDHAIQLKMYQMALAQSGVVVEKTFNLAPTDWRDMPTFKLKEQTGEVTEREVTAIMQLYFMRYYREPSSVLEINGAVNGQDLSSVVQRVPAREYALRRVSALRGVKEPA